MATSYLLRTCFALVSLRFEDEVIMYHILLLKFDVGYLGQQATGSLFGQTQSLFGQTPQMPTFGQTPQTPVFGQTQPQAQSSLFGGQPQQTSIFGQPQASQATFLQQQPSVLQSQPFGIPQQQSPFFNNAQITTQMAPIAPLVVPLPDREIQVIHDHHHLGEKVVCFNRV
jgi:nuclear pore complex protein Nup54